MDEKYFFSLDREEMRTRVKAITGFNRERNEIKTLAKIIFNNEVNDIIDYLKFLNLNGNVLLYGKPGTGKTSICYDCMLDNTEATFYQLNLSSIISEKLGKTAQKLTDIFNDILDEAKKYPIYLLIEEIEAFLPNRGVSNDLEDMKRALTIFMHFLDKLNSNLMILCTTNHLEKLDPAIIRRFSYKVEVRNNCIEDFESFFINAENPFHANFIDRELNKKIAEKVVENEMTFADVKNLMKRLLLENNEKGMSNVNSKNLYRLIMEEY